MKIRINDELDGTPTVRVLDEDGTPLGVMPLTEALGIASRRSLDLVEVNPKATPPVCRLLDYTPWKANAVPPPDASE